MRIPRNRTARGGGGFTLLEAMLALVVFGLVSLGLARSLVLLGEGSDDLQHDAHLSSAVQSLITEHGYAPEVVPGQFPTGPDAAGVRYVTTVELTELSTSDGVTLDEIYRIHVVASWDVGLGERSYEAETYRYAPLFANAR